MNTETFFEMATTFGQFPIQNRMFGRAAMPELFCDLSDTFEEVWERANNRENPPNWVDGYYEVVDDYTLYCLHQLVATGKFSWIKDPAPSFDLDQELKDAAMRVIQKS
jgi:hypothetical protein